MKDVVTTHAIIRWLERIKGIPPAMIAARLPSNPSDHRIAAEGCRMLGLTVEEASAIICPPWTLAAVQMGARAVRTGQFTLCCRDGIITTIMPGRARPALGHKPGVSNFRVERRPERRVRTDLRGLVAGAEA